MKATAKDLRFHAKDLLDAVSRGEEVTITYRGKPHAKLIPYEEGIGQEKSAESAELFGMWKDREETDDVTGYVRNIRKNRG
jgi:prevent-host-death family protein